MQATHDAVRRLTEAHTETVEGHVIEWQPLILWIKDRVTEINRRGNGSGGQGIPLNNDALDVLNHVERRYKLMCEAANIPPVSDLIAGTVNVWQVLQVERAGGRLDDAAWERVCDEFPDWVHRIQGEQDRPRKMELTVPCPRCEKRWTEDDLGRRVAAVVVEFAPGRAPFAECRTPDCGSMWAGWGDVARLGFTVGAEQNLEVLGACGINMPDIIGDSRVKI